MSVVRVNKNNNYTTMSNYHLRDKKLSLSLKGLLSVVYSLPENWDYSIAGLCSITEVSKSTMSKYLNELIEFGYLKREQKRTSVGFGNIEYIFYEYPINTENALPKNQDTQNVHPKNQDTENQSQSNYLINQLTKELNTNKKKTIVQNEILNERFNRFWNLFPRKETKKKAEQTFKNIKFKSDEQFEKFINHLENLVKNDFCNREKQFIPLPTTYLNKENWSDDSTYNDLTSFAKANNPPQNKNSYGVDQDWLNYLTPDEGSDLPF